MFELDVAIKLWRADLLTREAIRPGDLDELESHLRESTASLWEHGLSEEESFLLALRRLGHPTALEAEFAKSNGPSIWARRFLWMLSGYLVVVLLVGLAHLAAGLAVAGGIAVGAGGRSLVYLGGVTAVVCLVGWAILAAAVARGACERLRHRLDDVVAWLGARGPLLTGAILVAVGAVNGLARMLYPATIQQLRPSELHAFGMTNALYARPSVWLVSGLVLAWSVLTLRGHRDSRAEMAE